MITMDSSPARVGSRVMTSGPSDYGLWGLVVLNSAILSSSPSVFKPQTPRDWRSFGAFSAFLVALFTEMYGFPLTLYFLSGWLQTQYPDVNWLSHDSGHLLEMLFGWQGSPHFGPFHLLHGLYWPRILFDCGWLAYLVCRTKGRAVATTGLYAHVRHPSIPALCSSCSVFCCSGPRR